VHISDPNEFHAQQTLQALFKGKIALTEKTLGVNRQEFQKVLDYAEWNGLQSKLYLHLHYAHKLLTLGLPELLKRFTKEYGSVVATSCTFFEAENPNSDRRRLWLFELKNGGLFMDWIHPFEIYYKGGLVERFDLKEIKPYGVNQDYDTVNPTGIYAKVELSGTFFRPGTTAQIRIAIGLKSRGQKKCMRFVFEKGQCLELEFVNSEAEYLSDKRGVWILKDKVGGEIIASDSPTGPTPSDILVNDILELCRGRNPGFTADDMRAIFEPQWRYQEMLPGAKLVMDGAEVDKFVEDGFENRT
jgi:hypothetical protein